jgi:hypothetical protein
MTVDQVRAYEELYAKTWIAFEKQQIKLGKVKEGQRFPRIVTNAEKHAKAIARNENYANILEVLGFAKQQDKKLNFQQIAYMTELPTRVASHHLNVLANCNMVNKERYSFFENNKKVSHYLYFI